MKKKEVIALVVVVIIAVIMVSISSYAYFTAKVTGTATANTVTSGTMAITYADGPEVSLDNAIPGDSVTKTFTVTNTGNVDSTYDIYLSEVYNSFVDQGDLAYTLVSSDGGYSVTSDTQVPSVSTKIVSTQTIATSATHHYTLTIKFLAKDKAQDSNQGKKFSAKIQVNEYTGFKANLKDTLLANEGGTTAIEAKATPDFSEVETDDKGMFSLHDNYGISYYYRGNITTNNVLFGGFCWKVIRINGNGTTRMIYNGAPTNGTCVATGAETEIGTSAYNVNYNDNAYVGYMYGAAGATTYEATHANTNSSTIKTFIDNWYSNNLTSYSEKISDTLFYNNRSVAVKEQYWSYDDTAKGYGTNTTYYGGYLTRFTFKSPGSYYSPKNDIFTVSDTDVGNGKLTYPIGLITLDELGMAGAAYGYETNTTFYLYNGLTFWTMTPDNFISGDVGIFRFNSEGWININYSSDVEGVRPVINLKSDVNYAAGDGTSNMPYQIG